MIDAIIKGDGTSRAIRATLPTTYEELVTLAASGKLYADILLNAGGFAVPGTKLNKNNLLTDETAALYGAAGNEMNVNAVLKLLGNGGMAQVGDVRESYSTEMGDGWLLCNGDRIDADTYPKLAELVPHRIVWEQSGQKITGTLGKARAMCEKPGYWFLFPSLSVESDFTFPANAYVYRADTDEVITVPCPTGNTTATSVGIYSIVYNETLGKFVAAVGTNLMEALFYTSDDLSAWAYLGKADLDTVLDDGDGYACYLTDMIYDGVGYEIIAHKTGYTGTARVCGISTDLSTITKYASGGNTWYPSVFKLRRLPGNRWTYTRYYDYGTSAQGDYKLTAYAGGTKTADIAVTGASAYPGCTSTVYAGDVWILTPDTAAASMLSLYAYDTAEGKLMTITANAIRGVTSGTSYVSGVFYNAVNNEVIVYISASGSYYKAVISADADFSVADNYTVSAADALPDMAEWQNNYRDGTAARYESSYYYIYAPAAKYLPEISRDGYVYIYGG